MQKINVLGVLIIIGHFEISDDLMSYRFSITSPNDMNLVSNQSLFIVVFHNLKLGHKYRAFREKNGGNHKKTQFWSGKKYLWFLRNP